MVKGWLHGSLILAGLLFAISGTRPAAAQDSFFKGKTIRIVVGFSAGGGYDLYARAIARHMVITSRATQRSW